MLNENTVAKILEYGLQQGADFTEVFVEDSVASSINLLDQKIEEINSSNSFGIGVRLLYGNEAYYGYSSDSDEANLLKLTGNLGQSQKEGQSGDMQSLQPQSIEDIHHIAVNPETVSKSERVELLRELDNKTRNHGDDIQQVTVNMSEKKTLGTYSQQRGFMGRGLTKLFQDASFCSCRKRRWTPNCG